MTTTHSNEFANSIARPPVYNPPGVWYSRVRVFQATIPLASQASGDDVVLFQLPAGFRPAFGTLQTTASLGSATVAVGVVGTTGKYRAAATLTTADAPQLFGPTEPGSGPLVEAETVRLTIGAASLPASGKLVVRLFGSGAD